VFKDVKFKNRYRITGQLTAASFLHIGSGGTSFLRDRLQAMRTAERDTRRRDWIDAQLEGENPEVAEFYGAGDQLRIPGSSLKGVLAGGVSTSQLFGTVDAAGKAVTGGKVTFFDAVARSRVQVTYTDGYWLANRGTYILPNVGIDPRLRSAQEHLLYYTEVAPPGTVFEVTLLAENLEPEELQSLRQRLADTFRPGGSPLGAGTANGWGVVTWCESKVEGIAVPALQAWLAGPLTARFDSLFQTVPLNTVSSQPAGPRETLEIHVTLPFAGRMLVNDPTQERAKRQADPDGRYVVGKTPIRGADGSVYLPASSIRGALRAQARRIWQTVKWERANLNSVERRAINPRSLREVAHGLPAFHQLFGAGGWQSPITIADFTLANSEESITQHFVAIDRFHGGAAANRKFQALALDRPQFTGRLTLDLAALRRAGAGDWFYLFLLFLLRDLREGDIFFGAQSAKGYGQVLRPTIRVTGGAQAVLLQGVLDRDPESLKNPQLQQWNQAWLQLGQTEKEN